MSSASGLNTSVGLLKRLRARPADPREWARFEERYRPLVADWCRRWGLQLADAEDVTQTVMLQMYRAFEKFEYDPRRKFRAYLKTVARHACLKFFIAQKKQVQGTGDSVVLGQLQQAQAVDDFESSVENSYDLELQEIAMSRVRSRFAGHNWEAFCLLKIEGLSGADIEKRLGIKPASLYSKAAQILRAIAREVQILEEQAEKEWRA